MSIKISGKVVAGRGEQGAPGLSAYDLAVQNGFIGTEAEWLQSLQGKSPSFATPQATIDDTSGAPSVVVSATGPDDAKVFSFAFSGLRGQGVPSGGTKGQILVKKTNANYNTEWIDLPPGEVTSFNGRTGDIEPEAGDYTAADVGAITPLEVDSKISAAINGLINGAPTTYDTLKEIADYIAEDKNAATAMNLAISDKVPKTTTINGKPLNGNIELTAADVGAATMADIEAAIEASITVALNASY